MGRHYDWDKTDSFGAKINLVTSARGFGKTFGRRLKSINYCLKNGKYIAEISRYASNLRGSDSLQSGYFDKLVSKGFFKDYVFKVEGRKGYWAQKPKDGSKPEWNLLVYFVALTELQDIKQRTYANVRRVHFDEAIIDKRTMSRYLPDEYGVFVEVLDSLLRETADEPTKARTYLLGNSTDFGNPYFRALGINRVPESEFSWWLDGTVLFHNCKDSAYAEEKSKTLVGQLQQGRESSVVSLENRFIEEDNGFISKKPKGAVPKMQIRIYENLLTVYTDYENGYLYASLANQRIKNCQTYALTKSDHTINSLMLTRTEKLVKNIVEAYKLGMFKFETIGAYSAFQQVMTLFGLK